MPFADKLRRRTSVSLKREQIVDDRIHGRACGNEHHHCARLAKQVDELLDIRRATDVPVLRLLAQRRHFGRILVVASHGMSVIGHVQQEIAPHDAQANHADFKLLRLHFMLILSASFLLRVR